MTTALPVTVRIRVDLLKRIDDEARRLGCTRSELVRRAIVERLTDEPAG